MNRSLFKYTSTVDDVFWQTDRYFVRIHRLINISRIQSYDTYISETGNLWIGISKAILAFLVQGERNFKKILRSPFFTRKSGCRNGPNHWNTWLLHKIRIRYMVELMTFYFSSYEAHQPVLVQSSIWFQHTSGPIRLFLTASYSANMHYCPELDDLSSSEFQEKMK